MQTFFQYIQEIFEFDKKVFHAWQSISYDIRYDIKKPELHWIHSRRIRRYILHSSFSSTIPHKSPIAIITSIKTSTYLIQFPCPSNIVPAIFIVHESRTRVLLYLLYSRRLTQPIASSHKLSRHNNGSPIHRTSSGSRVYKSRRVKASKTNEVPRTLETRPYTYKFIN